VEWAETDQCAECFEGDGGVKIAVDIVAGSGDELLLGVFALRLAAFAGAIAGGAGEFTAGEELHRTSQRTAAGARGTAVDAGGPHRVDEERVSRDAALRSSTIFHAPDQAPVRASCLLIAIVAISPPPIKLSLLPASRYRGGRTLRFLRSKSKTRRDPVKTQKFTRIQPAS